GGGVGECTELFIKGQVDSLLLGGGQHMIDCIEAEDIITAAMPGDFNGDDRVDSADLGLLLAAYGDTDSPYDLNEDGVVDSSDLGILLGGWTG
ncbi:MAG: hypothetical protein MK085_09640, partial [Phycisphaerales bacterium]|nr:hypothetical protein [Phycisphaerales bacterium]